MNDQIKDRIAKIYELVKRGATEGEKGAAKEALDRLMSKYNLSEDELEGIDKKPYSFKYSTKLELMLFSQLTGFFLDESLLDDAYRTSYDAKSLSRCKHVVINLTYLDYVTLESSYEYFRRHMRAQWNKTCAPIIKRCRLSSTRKRKRQELQPVFFKRYIIASELVDKSDLMPIDLSNMSKAEAERLLAVRGVEGGRYNKQMTGGKYLTA